MQNVKNNIDEIDLNIDQAETVEELNDLANQCNDIAKNIRVIRFVLTNSSATTCAFTSALEEDLEGIEGAFSKSEKRALGYIQDKHADQKDEAEFGSHEDQVRSEYNSGRL